MANSNWRVVLGPLVTVATVIGIYVCDRYLFTVPNPGAISFLPVVFAAYIGGIGFFIGYATHTQPPRRHWWD